MKLNIKHIRTLTVGGAISVALSAASGCVNLEKPAAGSSELDDEPALASQAETKSVADGAIDQKNADQVYEELKASIEADLESMDG